MTTEELTIDQLLDAGKISLRTANCCRSVGLRTLADIQGYASQFGFGHIRGCGRKSQQELNVLIAENHNLFNHRGHRGQQYTDPGLSFIPARLKEPFRTVFETEVNGFFGPEKGFYLDIFPEVDTLLLHTRKKLSAIFVRRPEVSYDEVVRIWTCSGAVLRALRDVAASSNSDIEAQLAGCIKYFEDNLEYEKYRLAKEYMNEDQLAIIAREYDRLFSSMSPRSRNSMQNSSIGEEQLIRLVLSDALLNSSIRNCGRKSAEEIVHVFSRFPQTVQSVLRLSDAELQLRIIRDDYPFLSREEARYVVDFTRAEGHRPNLYIIYRYLVNEMRLHADMPYPATLHCRYYGIDCPRTDRAALSKEYGLTPERIRQIIVDYSFSNGFRSKVDAMDWSPYPEFREDCSYVNAIELYNRMRSTELSGFDGIDEISFVGLIAPIRRYAVFSRKGLRYLVDRRLTRQFDFSQALIRAEIESGHRHETDDPYDLDGALGALRLNGHLDSDSIANCLTEMLTSYLPIGFDNDGRLVYRQNYVRAAREAYEIIRSHGKPMTLEQLFRAFKTKFPDHKFEDAESLRCHLHPNYGFRAIGKKSTYSLDIWDYNTDTNTTLIHKILEKSKVPLHSTEIVKRLAEYGRESTPMLVVNFIYMDKKRGFKRFRNSYFGIEGREYPEEFVPLSADDMRYKTFERRLADLLEQRKDDFVSAHDHEFRTMCHAYRRFVEETGLMATLTTNRDLYRWFTRVYNERAVLNPFREHHFALLVDFLNAMGFKL